MNKRVRIIDINLTNISAYPVRCFLNPNDKGYAVKKEWLTKRFSEGLKIKQLYIDGKGSFWGFIEYVPGEYTWRAVDAKGYMFIHCLWVYPNKLKNKGYGSLLIKESIRDAKKLGCFGVAAVASSGSFMADKSIFVKNGFSTIEVSDKFELLVLPLKKGTMPGFKNWQKQLKKFKGLNIVYSNQCPWIVKSIDVLSSVAEKNGLELKVTELRTPKQAQNAPSIYSSFTLINDGRIIEDHYISETRFKNIIKKEKLKIRIK